MKLKKTDIILTKGKAWLSSFLTLLMALGLFVLLSGGQDVYSSPDRRFAFVCVFLLNCYLFFKLLYTGRTDAYRAVLFILFAVALSFTFIADLIEVRGSMSLHTADILECEVPFCHIVTTMVAIPVVLSNSIPFPGMIEGHYASISSMLTLVAAGILLLGRGFCSWACFYGGWDDAAARLSKKKRASLPKSLRWGGFAVLIIVAVSSAATLIPTYCDWACPYKAVTEYEAVTDIESATKMVIFGSLFAGLVIVAPFLTKKRTQCAWFCPMGALCSAADRISPFTVGVKKDKCIRCNKCIEICPMDALDAGALEKGNAHMQCVKCGKCIDACPKSAIGYRIRFTEALRHPTTTRTIFLFGAFGFLAVFSGGMIQRSILMILNLVATGSIYS
jgi:ferredoxin-type protein NapH